MAKPLSDRDLDRLYQDALRAAHGDTVEVCGLHYDTAATFEEVDPTAYRCGFNDWLDGEVATATLFEHEGEYFSEEPCLHDEHEHGTCLYCGEDVTQMLVSKVE